MLKASCHSCVVDIRWPSQLQLRHAPLSSITLVHLCVADAIFVMLLPSIFLDAIFVIPVRVRQ